MLRMGKVIAKTSLAMANPMHPVILDHSSHYKCPPIWKHILGSTAGSDVSTMIGPDLPFSFSKVILVLRMGKVIAKTGLVMANPMHPVILDHSSHYKCPPI